MKYLIYFQNNIDDKKLHLIKNILIKLILKR